MSKDDDELDDRAVVATVNNADAADDGKMFVVLENDDKKGFFGCKENSDQECLTSDIFIRNWIPKSNQHRIY